MPLIQSGSKGALATAYRISRENRARGGIAATPRGLYRKKTHVGPIKSMVPGRTDNHAMAVPSGSYVLPADHVSSLGEGNTESGMAVLREMMSGMGRGSGRASGGAVEDAPPVDIMSAGGEFVIPPEIVAEIGGGDMDQGHKVLDDWVLQNRKKHIRTLRGLAPPAKD